MPRPGPIFRTLALAALLALVSCGSATEEAPPTRQEVLMKFKASKDMCREAPETAAADPAARDAGPCP